MLRIVLILATCAFAGGEEIDSTHIVDDTVILRDSSKPQVRPSRMRVYHPSKEAQDAARSSPLSFFFPITKKDRDHYLRAAGRHWLISLGLGATGAAVGYFSDWKPGVTRAITVGTLIGAAGFQVMVPIDLILAGSAEK